MGNQFTTFRDNVVVSFSKLEICKKNDILALEDESIMFSRTFGKRLSRDVSSYTRSRETSTRRCVTYGKSVTKYSAITPQVARTEIRPHELPGSKY
jgi:hypothetical protein